MSLCLRVYLWPYVWLDNSIMRLSWLSLSMCLFPFAVRTSVPLVKDLSIYQLQCPLRPSLSLSLSLCLCVSLSLCVCVCVLLSTPKHTITVPLQHSVCRRDVQFFRSRFFLLCTLPFVNEQVNRRTIHTFIQCVNGLHAVSQAIRQSVNQKVM